MKNIPQPKISIIIPVYNAENYIRPCLDSIIGQTYQNLQIILIDDGSKDNSFAICQEYAARDARITAIYQENHGVSNARNRGLSLADGDYYGFVDGDDYISQDMYEKMMEKALEYSCDCVCCEYFITYPSREETHSLAKERYGLLDHQQTMKLLFNGIPFTWARLFSKKLVEGLLFDETIARGEDSLFNMFALHRAENSYFMEQPLYHYVQSDESACRGKFRPSQLSALRLIEIEHPFLKAHYPQITDAWVINMKHLLISLYTDMQADEVNYSTQMREVHRCFGRLCRNSEGKPRSVRYKLKFFLFRFFPKLFCALHRATS